MLNPDDRWIWDFWHARDGDVHHLFYLQAPKSLGDPELRHRNATIGHATSRDLTTWAEHGAVLGPGDAGDIDATATWTGSVVQGDDGLWRMFYTGSRFPSPRSLTNIETIGMAVSNDLHHWRKERSVSIAAHPDWYERLGDSSWPEEAWRDPWVYRAANGEWRMLITARSASGDEFDRGVVGLATSSNLADWTVQEPLTGPGAGFAHLEVLQAVTLGGRGYLLFSAHSAAINGSRRLDGAHTGTWIAPWDDRIRLEDAVNLTGPELYSGRLIDLDGSPVLLGFRLPADDGPFEGGISDPLAVEVRDGVPGLVAGVTG